MGEAIITRRGGDILKIAGQTEEIVRFGEAINKYDPVYVKVAGTKLSNPATLPTGTGNGVAFDLTGTCLAVVHNGNPYITIYKRNGDTFTKLSNPATLPTGIGNGVAFDPTGTYLAVGHGSSPYITIYLALLCFKTSSMSDISIGAKAGYAKESGVAGEYKKIVVIFR